MSTLISREIDVFESQGDDDDNIVNYNEDDRNSQVVEKLDTEFQTSFSKFKKRHLIPKKADFSDNISRPVQYGFRTDLSEYELEDTPTNETIVQKYQRLKLEVAELVSEVDKLKDKADSSELGEVNPSDVISDLTHLQSTLSQLDINRVITDSSILTGSGSAPQSVLFKELQAQVSASKAPPTESEVSGTTVYEVYGNMEAAKFGHLSKLSELEQRLVILEDVVGKGDASKPSVISAGLDSDCKDLSSAVLGLQSKVALLDGAHVSAITGQLNDLLTIINKVDDNKTKDSKDDTEHRTKVSEALETVSAISPLISVVPDVVNRLHALKDLHTHAAQLVTTISMLSTEQERIDEQLTTLKSLLEQVSTSVADNVKTLETNYEALESKMNSLSK